MKMFSIPKTDLQVSCISLGTGEFGGTISEQTAFSLLDQYLSAGGNLIDTAHVYANWHPQLYCSSEKTIGSWLRERGGRDRLILASKGCHPPLSNLHQSRMSKEALVTDLEEGLGFSQTDYFDIYYLHRDDVQIPAGEIIEWMNEQKKQGKIRALGCSNWSVARIAEANRYAETHGLSGFVISEIFYNMATPLPGAKGDDTLAYMDAAAHEFYCEVGMPVAAFSSQAHGYFSRLAAGIPLSDSVKAGYDSEENRALFRRLQQMAAEKQVSVTTLLLAFLYNQPFPCIPVVGCRTLPQLSDSLAGAGISLTAEELERLR